MKLVKAWAVLENGQLRDTDDIQQTRARATSLAAYLQRHYNCMVSIIRVEIRELPKKVTR